MSWPQLDCSLIKTNSADLTNHHHLMYKSPVISDEIIISNGCSVRH